MNLQTRVQTGPFAATQSYAKLLKSMVGVAGFEPTTLCSQSMDTALYQGVFFANNQSPHKPRVKAVRFRRKPKHPAPFGE